MENSREQLLERVTRSIDIMQDIQADSRTPLGAAIAVVDPIRNLTDSRRAMRNKLFVIEADNALYVTAIAKLKEVTDTLATDLVAHESHMQFVTLVAQTAEAVLKVAIAVAAIVVV